MPYIVKVPTPSRTAFKPDRSLEKNLLIESQVKHFHHVDKNLPPHLQTGVEIATVTTEGQAAEYIRKVTRAIHRSGGRRAEKVEKAR